MMPITLNSVERKQIPEVTGTGHSFVVLDNGQAPSIMAIPRQFHRHPAQPDELGPKYGTQKRIRTGMRADQSAALRRKSP